MPREKKKNKEDNSLITVDELGAGEQTEASETAETAETAETSDEGTASEEVSPADKAREEQEARANAMAEGHPRMYLKEYYVELPVGTTIDAMSYIDTITDDVESYEELSMKIQIYDMDGRSDQIRNLRPPN